MAGLAGSVNLTMPAAAWLDLSDAPGEAAGFGPLDAATRRRLAGFLATGRARWCVILTGPDGRAVAHACARHGPGPPGPGPPGAVWLTSLTFDWLEQGCCNHARQTSAYRPGRRLQHLITLFGAEHGLGGSLDMTPPRDHGRERRASGCGPAAHLSLLRTEFYPGDSAWQAARDALTAGPNPVGRVESKPAEAPSPERTSSTRWSPHRPRLSGTKGATPARPLDLLTPDPVLAGFAQDAVDAGLGLISDDELVGLLCAA
jgi:hypothetical protein